MISTSDRESNLFSSIAGLPLHPLVVHLAVVVLPASAIALVAIIAVPRWRRPYGWITVVAALVGATGAFLAKESGEALAAQVGLPADHARWGDWLYVAAAVFAVVTVLWFAVELRARRTAASSAGLLGPRRGREADRATASSTVARSSVARSSATRSSVARGSVASTVTGGAAVVLSLVVLALTVVVGHSGATAAWGGGRSPAASSLAGQGEVTAAAPGRSRPSPSASPTASDRVAPQQDSTSSSPAPASSSGPTTFSLSDVSRHASGSSCWTAIDGRVYDLTQWIDAHPGGSDAILGICGTDATAAYDAQHGGDGRVARELATFRIGLLR